MTSTPPASAIRLPIVHEVDQTTEPVRVGRGEDPVSQVEDVAPAPAELEHLERLQPEHLPRREAGGRVEIPLHDRRRAQAPACVVERGSPVDSDDLGRGLGQEPEQLPGGDSEVDPGNAEVLEALEDPEDV